MGEDAKKLLADCGLTCAPIFEVGDAAVRLQQEGALTFPHLPAGDAVRPGLRGLALACGFDLEKPKKLSRSNWERRPLTPDQQRYAAYDAYAGVWIGRCLHALHTNADGWAPNDFGAWLVQQADAQAAHGKVAHAASVAAKAARRKRNAAKKQGRA